MRKPSSKLQQRTNNARPKPLWMVLFLAALSLYSCASNPYSKTNKLYKENAKRLSKQLLQLPPPPFQGDSLQLGSLDPSVSEKHWIGSYHFNLRKPNYVIIHHTAQNSLQQTIRTFTVPHTQVSSHYVIGRDGTIVQMLNDYVRGWHAGAGKWGSLSDLNSTSIGIELDNNGSEIFPDAQIRSLLVLLDTLKNRHNIPTENFLAHSDIAPGRKQDPSALFPWAVLSERGFGYWIKGELVDPPVDFNPLDALRIIGFDTKNVPAAISSFNLHYVQVDTSPEWTDHDLRVLYNIYRQCVE